MGAETILPSVMSKKLPPNLEKIKYGHYTKGDVDYSIHLYLKENDLRVDENGSEVIKFLRGKCILVTGATGFLGKLLMEKLLRCCRDIEAIYVIVRTKKGKDMETRLQEYLNDGVFSKLSEIDPNFKKKVVGVSGDMEEEGLGLLEESRKMLTEKVNIIYHVAATVRFDEKLKKAVQINIKGTKEIIKIAKECKSLDVLTYMSTAYSNCCFKDIKEEFYPPMMDADELIAVTDTLSSEVIDRITPGLLKDAPNTYTFTKQITEDVIRRESVGLPTCIQRPSIVIATAKEPVRSWLDNIYGPAGLFMAAGLGLIHVMYGNPTGRCDLVPADYVINNCIAASYKTAKDRRIDKVQIFNFTNSNINPLYWQNMIYIVEEANNVGTTKAIMKIFCVMTKPWYWYQFLNFIFHTIPAQIIDFILVKLEKKAPLSEGYQKFDKFVSLLSYFTLNEWNFVSTNSEELWKSLNEKDKSIFAYDMSTFDWREYFDTFFLGLREFLLKEDLNSLEEGRSNVKRIHLIFYSFVSVILALAFHYCWNTIFGFVPIFIVFLILYFTYSSWYQ